MAWYDKKDFTVRETGFLGNVIGSTNNATLAKEAARSASAISPDVISVDNSNGKSQDSFWLGGNCPHIFRPRN